MNRGNKSKIWSVMLSLLMVISMMPALAYTSIDGEAADDSNYGELHNDLCEFLIGKSFEFKLMNSSTPGHATPGHATPGHATPGYATPGYSTPGYATPGNSGRNSVGGGSVSGGISSEEEQKVAPNIVIAIDNSMFKNKKGNINISLNEDQSKSIIEQLDKGNKNIEINLPKDDSKKIDSLHMQIPVNVIDGISNYNAKMKVTTPLGNISLDDEIIEAIANRTNGRDVVINISKSENKKLSYTEYNLSITYKGGKLSPKFDRGIMTVTLPGPYAKDNNDRFAVITKSGKYAYDMGANMNPLDRTATFVTTYLSKYIVANGKAADKMISKSVRKSTVRTSSVKFEKGNVVISYSQGKGNIPTSYVIYRSNNKKSGYRKIAITNSETQAFIDEKLLRKRKKYFYRVRGIVNVGGKNVYTKYSSSKAIKIK